MLTNWYLYFFFLYSCCKCWVFLFRSVEICPGACWKAYMHVGKHTHIHHELPNWEKERHEKERVQLEEQAKVKKKQRAKERNGAHPSFNSTWECVEYRLKYSTHYLLRNGFLSHRSTVLLGAKLLACSPLHMHTQTLLESYSTFFCLINLRERKSETAERTTSITQVKACFMDIPQHYVQL